MLWLKSLVPELRPIHYGGRVFWGIRWVNPFRPTHEPEWMRLDVFLGEQVQTLYNAELHRLMGDPSALETIIQIADRLPPNHPLKEKAQKAALLHGILIADWGRLQEGTQQWLEATLKGLNPQLPPPPEPKDLPPLQGTQAQRPADELRRWMKEYWRQEMGKKWLDWALELHGSDKRSTIKDKIVSKLTDRLLADKEFVEALLQSPLITVPPHDALKDKAAFRSLAYGVIDGLVGVWAQTASDKHPLAWALQIAIAQEFGLKNGYEAILQRLNQLDKEEAPGIIQRTAFLYNTLKPILHKYVRAVYDETQEFLERSGLERLCLVRGLKLPERLAANLSEQHFTPFKAPFLPASSWTLEYWIAEEFATESKAWEELGESTIYYIEIPKEAFRRILSTSLTGWGCYTESEFGLLSDGEQEVLAALID